MERDKSAIFAQGRDIAGEQGATVPDRLEIKPVTSMVTRMGRVRRPKGQAYSHHMTIKREANLGHA